MNAITTAANTATDAASPKLCKPGKIQRRMARAKPVDAEHTVMSPAATARTSQREPAPAHGSKTAAVTALLSRDRGATAAELIAATGWLPHTMRAAMTGLRKKGHTIERSKRGTETCYTIKAATAS